MPWRQLKVLAVTPRLADAIKHYKEIAATTDPFPGDRLMATCNAAGVVADAACAAEESGHEIWSAVREIISALESTHWSSGCWCSGKDKRGHSATCAGRQAAITALLEVTGVKP
jgi:hypothetical protein